MNRIEYISNMNTEENLLICWICWLETEKNKHSRTLVNC
jgi:hypothetical protein